MSDQPMEQGPAPSIEQRAAALFMDPPPAQEPKAAKEAQPDPEQPEAPTQEVTEADSETDAPTPEEFFEFEDGGERYQIPKKLEPHFQKAKDYTQKTQAIAEQKRAYELLHEQARISNMRVEFEQTNSEDLSKLRAYDAVLSQPVDWSQMDTNEAFRRKLQIDQWKDERAAIAAKLQGSYQELQGKQEASVKELKAKAMEVLSKAIPNWSEAEAKAIREHALSDGYTEAELNSILDPRHTKTLWKARQYDLLKSKATKAVSDVKTVKTTAANPMPQHVKDKLNFRKAVNKTPEGSRERRKLVEQRAAQIFQR